LIGFAIMGYFLANPAVSFLHPVTESARPGLLILRNVFFMVIALFLSLITWTGLVKMVTDLIHDDPLLAVDVDGFRYLTQSADLIPWSAVADVNPWIGAKGGSFGVLVDLKQPLSRRKSRWRYLLTPFGTGGNQPPHRLYIRTTYLDQSTHVVVQVMQYLADRNRRSTDLWHSLKTLID
ncbi:MAG TPA: hypothetical protein VF920_13785, partial [Dongiaceae bacterium]